MENLSPDMRRFKRKPYMKPIQFSFSPEASKFNKDYYGKTIDICDAGIGIETDYPIAPGHTLWLNDGTVKTGIVKWAARVNNRYRAGIELNEMYYKEIIGDRIERYRSLLDEETDRFISRLEEIEKRCQSTTRDEKILNDVKRIMDDMMSFCEEFEKKAGYSKEELKKIISRFHRDTNPILFRSYCIKRARIWPQGYQGDYKTLETIYRNTPCSDGLGYYLDLWALDLPLGHAVRNRIKRLENMLREEVKKRFAPKVLNIACGSCRELIGLANEIQENEARIICTDTDNDALNHAETRLKSIGIDNYVEFRKYNALRMFDDELNSAEFGKQDIIYSVGLFDYLPDEFLIKLLSALYNLLDVTGTLIAAFKDADRYRSQEYHWILNWDGFLQRNERDFRNILYLAGIPDSAIREEREETGLIIFYRISK
ncbi:MAG: methyltransferase domain-containing protein [Thermodesulfovibrionales bacterium]